MHLLSRSAQPRTLPIRSDATGPQGPQVRPGQQARQFVSWSALRVLECSPWAATLLNNFQFQSPGECVTNSEVMQEHILHALSSQNQIEIAGSSNAGGFLQRLQHKLGMTQAPELDRKYLHDPTVDKIVMCVEQCGPCVLSLARLLPPDQGGMQYAGHHAVLVIGTFMAEGRNWAVALDGNDLQSNPAMVWVRAYADKYYEGCLESITEGDLWAIQTEMRQAGEPGDPKQVVYSFIDLDRSVSEANKAYRAYKMDQAMNGHYSDLAPITFPNSICVPTNATVKVEPMTEEIKQELARIVGSKRCTLPLLKVRAAPEEL